MPGGPRSETINEDEVGTYHCYNRCVRRAYLCGYDAYTDRNYDYRKDWFREYLVEFAQVFAIDVSKYAVQDNHFHVILRNRPDKVRLWSDEKVLRRAMQLFPETFRRKYVYVEPHEKMPPALLGNQRLICDMRQRMSSISWLMKLIQERFAKRANREDGVTGVFWDGRFRAEALLDSAAVLAGCVYVDLNPVRSGKYKTPEKSKYTSLHDRLQGLLARRARRRREAHAWDGFLCPLNTLGDYKNEDLASENRRATNDGILDMTLGKYAELVDYVGRQIRSDKRGAIPADLPPILERLGIAPEQFVDCITAFGSMSRRAIGSEESLRKKAAAIGRRWLHGVKSARRFFKSTQRKAGN